MSCPGAGVLFGIARAHFYAPYFPRSWRNSRQGIFGIERRIQGEVEATTPKQQPQRASLLATGDGAGLASPLSRLKARSHSRYTGNGYATIAIRLHQAWHSGYYEGSTTRSW